jgi:hypothetical protein
LRFQYARSRLGAPVNDTVGPAITISGVANLGTSTSSPTGRDGTDRNFDTNVNDRLVGVARNTGEGFDFASFDLRLSRRIRFSERSSLEVIAEGFNLFNRANLQLPNNVFGTRGLYRRLDMRPEPPTRGSSSSV